ncbi:MAG TPA: competence/damage-inducible protein A [Firmicutes bacterium]|nr:competence/damage-inducible protein A [Bacillota bacterium]
MKAELISIGTELLLGEVIDTNAAFLAARLAHCGLNLYYKSVVGDNLKRGSEILKTALLRSDVVVINGGLGPTADDLTREIVSKVTDRRLVGDPALAREIKAWFQKRHGAAYKMPANNLRQAVLPQGARPIRNTQGTAPGFFLELGAKLIVALPGVPGEMKTMFTESVEPHLKSLAGGQILVSRNLNFAGIGESSLEEKLSDLLAAQANPSLALYASRGAVRLRLTAKAQSEKEGWRLIAPWEKRIRERCAAYLYGTDEETLEQAVGLKLSKAGLTVSLAESCTGGLIGHRLTNIPGSSNYFLRGYVAYSNEAKIDDLKVPRETLAEYGAVSEQTARAMAKGVQSRAASDFGLAVTGIAGPGGASAAKPVGLVYIGLASPGDTIVVRHNFSGSREQIKERAAQTALYCLWRAI